MKVFFISILLTSSFVLQAYAGHHFESDLGKKYPQLDLTDIFVFQSSTKGKTVFIMGFNPKSKKDSFSNYASNGIYRFCISGSSNFNTGISPTFTFKDNKIQFYMADSAEPRLDVLGTFIAEGPINRNLRLSNGISIWTGTVLDLFQGNSAGINKFKQEAAAGRFDLSTFDIGEEGNFFKNLPSSVIVIEIPNTMLPQKLHYYATTAVELEANHWHRVNRIAHVLFPHLYLLDNDLKIKYLESNHEVDTAVRESIYNNVLNYSKMAGYKSNPEEYTSILMKQIYPDILTYEVGTDAEYTLNRINGRPLQADAMDVALALLVGSDVPIDDKVSIILERFQKDFPYVVPIDDSYANAVEKEVFISVDEEGGNVDDSKTGNKYNKFWYFGIGLIVLFILGYFFKKKVK